MQKTWIQLLGERKPSRNGAGENMRKQNRRGGAAYSEGGKGIGADFKSTLVDPVEESPEHPVSRLWYIWIHSRQRLALLLLLARAIGDLRLVI